MKAFDHEVVDFLLKPIVFSRFVKAISRVEISKDKEEAKTIEINHIFVNINKKLVRLELSEIDFIESDGNYVKVHRSGKDALMVHTTLKSVIESLSSSPSFLQVRRSFVININRIVDIEDSTIVISKSVIPIGKSYREKLMDHLKFL